MTNTKTKKSLLFGSLVAVILTVSMALSFFFFGRNEVQAETVIPEISADTNENGEKYLDIIAANLKYGDYVYIYYAVDMNLEGVGDESKVKMLFWNTPQSEYTLDAGTHSHIARIDGKKNTLGNNITLGEITYTDCAAFSSYAIAPKEFGDTVYARAYIECEDGSIKYSNAVKYSVLEYVYSRRVEKAAGGNVTDDQMKLYSEILNYGANSQKVLNYKTDRLVTGDVSYIEVEGGKITDGFTSGYYLSGDEVTLAAYTQQSESSFTGWENSKGETLSSNVVFTFTVTTEADREIYTAVYTCSHSFGEYLPDGNATCTADGTKTAKCDGCGETDTVTDAGSALGHSYGTPVFTWEGYSSASVQFVCTRDASHTETVAATITSEVTKESTLTEHGTRLYTATAVLLGVTYTDTKTEELPTESYVREGNYIYFGTYPQSAVNDSALNTTLTSLAGTLPTSVNSQAWTSYGYYISGSNTTDYMWYIDITHGSEKYRGVYFTNYRPDYTTDSSSASNTYQDDNGYGTSRVHWFKYEPIKWRILTETNGKAMLLCELLIDSQEFYHSNSDRTINGSTVYASNYEYSNIRAWLNDNFYNTAFNDMQKEIIQLTTVDNSPATTQDSGSSNKYACNNTKDKLFLLSYKDVVNASYGFASGGSTYDAARQKKATDYAKCQGVYTETSGTYAGNCHWWLRSAKYPDGARRVDYYGRNPNYRYEVMITTYGICPALWISLE